MEQGYEKSHPLPEAFREMQIAQPNLELQTFTLMLLVAWDHEGIFWTSFFWLIGFCKMGTFFFLSLPSLVCTLVS